MNVHVDVGGLDVEIDEVRHLHPLRHKTVVGRNDSLVEIRVLHIAAIDEEIVLPALLAGGLRLGDETSDPAHRRVGIDGKQILSVLPAEHVGDALQQGARSEVHQLGAVAVEREVYLGIYQHDTLKGRQDIVKLGGIALEEFPAHGHIIEQILHLEVGPHGAGHRLLPRHLGAGNGEQGAQLIALQARLQLHLRHGGNRCQSLAPESHGAEGKEVIGLQDFRCGMALKGQTRVGGRHTLSVVDDLDGRAPGIQHDDADVAGTGVHGVLHQLLDDGSRALDNLAGCYLVGDGIGK